MSQFEIFTPQPGFPNDDLTEVNASHVEYMLHHDRVSDAYADMLRGSLRQLHTLGHSALSICGIEVEYSEKEYDSFCAGFAALEFTRTLVAGTQYDGGLAVANTKDLLIDTGDIAEFELADRYDAWMKTHPQTFGTMANIGAARGETMQQLHARTIGAHVASGLQMVI